MDTVLTKLKWEICLSYLDASIVFAKDWASHMFRLRQVFQQIREAGLKLQPSKSTLGFLGHMVSPQGIRPDTRLPEAIQDITPPSSMKETCSYLELISYYRQFILQFACIAAPLHWMLHKGAMWDWTDACQEAFQTVKDKLLNLPIAAYPDFKQETEQMQRGEET